MSDGGLASASPRVRRARARLLAARVCDVVASGVVARASILASDGPLSAQADLAAHRARRHDVAMFQERLASWVLVDGERRPGPTMCGSERARWSERLRSMAGCVLDAEQAGVERLRCAAAALADLSSRQGASG